MFKISVKFAAALTALTLGVEAHGGTLYVTASGAGDCSNWSNACNLTTAVSNAAPGDEIWAQAGTYGPFTLKNGAKIIGGFSGTETAASQSDPTANETIVDGGTSNQCVTSTDDAASTMLRGFTLQNCRDSSDDGGGGLVATDSSALIVQCVFKDNRASRFGAAAAVRGNSSPHFINCTFHDNGTGTGSAVTPLGAGAVYIHNGTPSFTNCLFYNNKAIEGGAVLIHNGTPTFVNCTFANNQATIGEAGGLFDELGAAEIKNSIFWGNQAGPNRTSDHIFNGEGSTSLVTYSDVQGGFPGTNNIDADPLFVNAAGGDYKLQRTSPCVGAAQYFALPADVADLDWDMDTTEKTPVDLWLNTRFAPFGLEIGVNELPPSGGGGKGGEN